MQNFKIISEITDREEIAKGSSVKVRSKLIRQFGRANWRKMKGTAIIEVEGQIKKAELHWYEAHGKGKKLVKIKMYLR